MGYQRGAQTKLAETNRHKNGSTSGKPLLPNRIPAHPILELQKTIGNQAVQHLIQTCPVFPNRCPFIRLCHTCPAIIQAEQTVGQPRRERIADVVSGVVPIIEQPSENTCWAAVATMLVSWRDQKSYTIKDVMERAGPAYRARFDGNKGLSGLEKGAFLTALGLRAERPASYTVSGLRSLLKTQGPLWATTEEPDGIHGRIITGIFGDGTVDGTDIQIIDPAGGRQYLENFIKFMQKYESVFEPGVERIQIVHF